MTAGALTYVLVLIFNLGGATVPGYDSIASCEAAGREAMKIAGMRNAQCIPGPVAAR